MAKGCKKGTARLRAAYTRFLNDAEFIPPAEHLRRMIASWSDHPDDAADPVESAPVPMPAFGDNAMEASTRKFLADLNRDNPDGVPGKTKGDVWDECRKAFGVSRRAFDSIWRFTVGPAFKKRGPHRPRRR